MQYLHFCVGTLSDYGPQAIYQVLQQSIESCEPLALYVSTGFVVDQSVWLADVQSSRGEPGIIT